jgi:hypothetical protein
MATTEMSTSTLEEREQMFQKDLNALRSAISKVNPDEVSDDAIPTNNALLRGTAEAITANVHWWGFDINCNEKLTQDIIAGVTGTQALGGLIGGALAFTGVVTGGIAALLGAAFAAAFALKAEEIKLINNGNGVNFPISWLQLAPVISSIPGGPSTIIIAIMAFIHPVRN